MSQIWIRIPEKLELEITDIKTETRLTWSQLLVHLCNTIPRPRRKQRDYKPFFIDSNPLVIFRRDINPDAEYRFNHFSNAFLKKWYALDYLVKQFKDHPV